MSPGRGRSAGLEADTVFWVEVEGRGYTSTKAGLSHNPGRQDLQLFAGSFQTNVPFRRSSRACLISALVFILELLFSDARK